MPNRSQEHLIRVGRAGFAPPPAAVVDISPNMVVIDTGIAIIQVGGSGFNAGSVVYIGGVAYTTRYYSPSFVEADFNTTGATAQTLQVAVSTDGKMSNSVPLVVTTP